MIGDREWINGVCVCGECGEEIKSLWVWVCWCPKMIGVGSSGLCIGGSAVGGLERDRGVVGVVGCVVFAGGLVVAIWACLL